MSFTFSTYPKMEALLMALEPGSVVNAKLQVLSDMLREEGYIAQIDDDGDFKFKAQGHTVFLYGDIEDERYVRLSCLLGVEPGEPGKGLWAAHVITSKLKVIKAYVVDETTVCISAELFVENAAQFRPIFSRTIDALMSGVNRFWTELEKA
jgi:hypothetical protein